MINNSMPTEFNDDILQADGKEYINVTTNNPIPHRENYLLIASSNLLSWLIILRSFQSEPSIEKVKDILSEEIKKFDSSIQRAGYDTRTFLAARYCICTAIDEAILNTSWGSTCGWAENNLLSTYYNETSGGERFYIILEAMGEKPEKNIDLLELMYIILSLGFKGKLYDKGKVVLEATQYQLFQKISPYLTDSHTPLCFFMRKPKIGKKRSFVLPLWSCIIIFLATFLITESVFEYKTYELEEPVLNIIDAYQRK